MKSEQATDMRGMKFAALKHNSMPRDIDIPETVERSCKGALYLTTSYKPVTDGELAYIKQAHPSVFEQLRIINPEGEAAANKAAVSARAEVAAAEGVEELPSVAEAAPLVTRNRRK